jgi:hypothetical protein
VLQVQVQILVPLEVLVIQAHQATQVLQVQVQILVPLEVLVIQAHQVVPEQLVI